jgi:transposase
MGRIMLGMHHSGFQNLPLMPNNPISMVKIRQLLRLYAQGKSKHQIAQQTGISRNTLKKYLKDFDDSKMSFEEVNELTDKDLEDLFIKPVQIPSDRLQQLFKQFPEMDKELRRKGVTRQTLWEEYRRKEPAGIGRSQFNHYFSQWKNQANPTMRIEHKAGDKLYVDFAGEHLKVIDKETGELQLVEVFLGVLGASQLTFIHAVPTQQKEDFISACEEALHFFGGVPSAIVPDNLKSAVTRSSRYEPILNEAFASFAEHYGTTILPARAYRPRDKALVENAVRISYSRVYAKIRHEHFYSLKELNDAILLALNDHNNALLTGRNYSRRQQFEEVERSTLQPLPASRYEMKKQIFATVMKNGHVALSPDKHYYSVPYRYIGRKVKIMYTRKSVEVYYNYQRIALHVRLKSPYQYTTDKDHLASTHRFVSDWTPERFITWAEAIHEDVKHYILKVLDRKQHPEQAYKSCVGILGFAKKVGNDRLTKACQRALGYGIHNYKTIQNILEKGLDSDDEKQNGQDELNMPEHENIRGENYYQ